MMQQTPSRDSRKQPPSPMFAPPTTIAPDLAPPERSSSSSAPPVLELATQSLFAFTVKYASVFSDIRAHEDYPNFYVSYNEKEGKLPPPLEATPFVFENQETEPPKKINEANFETMELNAEDTHFFSRLQKESKLPAPPTASIWTPQPRKPARLLDNFTEGTPRIPIKLPSLEKIFAEPINYASSPNAQTALNTAQFIWKDEEQEGTGPSAESSQNPSAQGTAKGVNGSLFKTANGTTSAQRVLADSDSRSSDSDESSSEAANKAQIACRYYAAGYCSRGEKCHYSHDVEKREVEVVEEPKSSKQDAKASKSPKGSKGFSPRKQPTPQFAGFSREQMESGKYNFDSMVGHIYQVCKDQHGCRYLQKKLEEQEPRVVDVIFTELFDHITELMTDPFGNYLCQKLLEHCNDHQRFLIIQKVAPDLVSISKNMHGTRAVQKMVECLSSPPQIDIVKKALGSSVVSLIQDLNGNHVIQRCLNRLSPEDNQFIYDAVTYGNHCVQVATHRHGCCVLQRCIDHASDKQKVQLIHEITKNALVLVQDAFGNYVVQYVLDLPFPELVRALALAFLGHLRQLSAQKFSSNVVEKVISITDPGTRTLLVQEVIDEPGFAEMLQDPFANYVIQTALNVADQKQHDQLVENIKPHLNKIRNTPFGKRIQAKINKEGERQAQRYH